MKTLIFTASPNKQGNTEIMTKAFLEKLSGESYVINSYNVNIEPCIDCKFCYSNEGECSIKDDMTKIYQLIEESDNIVVFSPMYFASYPGTFKNIIDRTQIYWSKKHILNIKENKKRRGILFINAGSEWEGMFNHMEKMFKYFMKGLNGELVYNLYVPNTDNFSVKENNEVIEKIYNIAKKIS
ncbi:flavodoxin family protein [Clostridium brassicae]|uniref:Flavodoxin family protein n=1 Tax=Clostridium brassicae TaxID=2999072 RepID=A0ABT4D7M3_9CLOT|nr:flavodoxin family protein [Clostridium brassicae]MCY6957678.1 flavodoxin family protein [Clostridium brassicae]